MAGCTAWGLRSSGLRSVGAPKGLALVPGFSAVWLCNEGTGQVLTDYSGNGNHGTLGSTTGADTNDPTWGVTGLTFGGDDYVDMGMAPILNGYSAYTLVAAITVNDLDAHTFSAVMGRVRLGASPEFGIAYRSTGAIYSYRSTGAVSNPVDTTTGGDGRRLVEGTPATITITADATTHAIYLNGTVSKSAAGAAVALNATSIFYLGKQATTNDYNPACTFHAALVYPFALTPALVAQNYAYLKAIMATRGVTLA